MNSKPDFVTEKHLEYLDELRASGKTNMFGASPYILDEFPEITEEQAKKILLYWIKSFEERNKE